MNASSLAETWQDGELAKSNVEDRVDDLWPSLVHHIYTDHYDNSLEIYFAENADAGLSMTEDQAKEIRAMGFGRCWLNFLDGTEQYAGLGPAIAISERKKVEHPHWLLEKMNSKSC